MKIGRVIARRRFWNKYGNSISNVMLVFSIVLFSGMFALTTYGNPFEQQKANASYETISETKTVSNVVGNTITTIDNETYTFENAENTINSIQDKNGLNWEILIVDGKVINLVAIYE